MQRFEIRACVAGMSRLRRGYGERERHEMSAYARREPERSVWSRRAREMRCGAPLNDGIGADVAA